MHLSFQFVLIWLVAIHYDSNTKSVLFSYWRFREILDLTKHSIIKRRLNKKELDDEYEIQRIFKFLINPFEENFEEFHST